MTKNEPCPDCQKDCEVEYKGQLWIYKCQPCREERVQAMEDALFGKAYRIVGLEE